MGDSLNDWDSERVRVRKREKAREDVGDEKQGNEDRERKTERAKKFGREKIKTSERGLGRCEEDLSWETTGEEV